MSNLSDFASDLLCYPGGAVKALDDGTVEGQLVLFSTASDPDLQREFFTKATDFWGAESASVLYHHGLDPKLKKRRIGKAVLTVNDAGVWAKAQLERRDAYEEKIYELAKAGKLGWSSGTAGHLVETKAIGNTKQILTWPIFEATLTPTPVEPRARAVVSVKSLLDDDLASVVFDDGDETPAAKGFKLSELSAWLSDTRTAIKAGRSVSASTRKRLLAIHDHMGAAHGDLASFLRETDPDGGASGASGGLPAKSCKSLAADPLVLAKAMLSL